MNAATFHWPWRTGEHARVRAALIERSGSACERCGGQGWIPNNPRSARLIVHHERYGKRLKLSDFLLLCRGCHRRRHHEPGAPKMPPRVRATGRRPGIIRSMARLEARDPQGRGIREIISAAMAATGTVSGAAQVLGISPATLLKWVEYLGGTFYKRLVFANWPEREVA